MREYDAARRARAEHRERALSVLEGFDLLVTPTLGFVAPAADVVETEIRGAFTLFTFPFNALGWPALALPAGPAENGLPASIQVVGGRETTLWCSRQGSRSKPLSRPERSLPKN